MRDKLNIIFFGDIVGKPGRTLVADYVASNNLSKDNFLIANIENASHGFGLTEKNYEEFVALGIDVMTSGNHIWDKKDIFNYIDNAEKLLRPINYAHYAPGVGSKVFENVEVKAGQRTYLHCRTAL